MAEVSIPRPRDGGRGGEPGGGRGGGRGGRRRRGGGRGGGDDAATTTNSEDREESRGDGIARSLDATARAFTPRSLPPRPPASTPAPTPTPAPPAAKKKKKKPAKPRRGDDDDDGDDDDGPASSADDAKKKRVEKKKKPRPTTATKEWWRTLTESDPITLDPLCELPYPPFDLDTTTTSGGGGGSIPGGGGDAAAHLFDGVVLAEYVTTSKQFENPLNRVPMDAKDCARLDAYLKKHRLKTFDVMKTFHAAAMEREKAAEDAAARANETEEAAAARRAAAQTELAQSLFTSLRARASRSAAASEREARDARGIGGRTGTGAARRGRGRLTARDEPEWTGDRAGWEDYAHLLTNDAEEEAFPSLGGGGGGVRHAGFGSRDDARAPAQEAFPALAGGGGAAAAAAAAATTTSRWGTTVPEARPDPVAPPPPPPVEPTDGDVAADATAEPREEEQEEEDPAAARRRQLAEAFGIDRPERHASMFAAASAEAFDATTLATARAHPAAIEALEKALEAFALKGPAGPKRLSLDPAPRRLRGAAHALARAYGCASHSYGDEPRKRVDVFRTDATAMPSSRLSDAVLALDSRTPEEIAEAAAVNAAAAACAAGLGPSRGDFSWFEGWTERHSDGAWTRLELFFDDIASGGGGARGGLEIVSGALSDFSGEYALQLVRAPGTTVSANGGSEAVSKWRPGDALAAHFWRKSVFDDACNKLGGGSRGRFKVRAFKERGASADESADERAERERATEKMREKEPFPALGATRRGPPPAPAPPALDVANAFASLLADGDGDDDDDDGERVDA